MNEAKSYPACLRSNLQTISRVIQWERNGNGNRSLLMAMSTTGVLLMTTAHIH
jgi:hypothetical protein